MWRHKKAQSLVELSIFGALIISLLGILINYGLRYNYQQRIIQETFTRALRESNQSTQNNLPISTSYLSMKDIQVADPSHPFAMGQVMPVAGSAAVTRSHLLGQTPETYNELPELRININGVEKAYKTANFVFNNFNNSEAGENAIEKYQLIYGAANVEKGACVAWENPADRRGREPDPEYQEEPVCTQYQINVIDSGLGEIVDYDSAVRRCRMIMDEGVCVKECQKDAWDATDSARCVTTCNQTIQVPPYCTEPDNSEIVKKLSNPQYQMAKMGLQENYQQNATFANTLEKEETPAGITTTDNTDWQVTTNRAIVSSAGEEGVPTSVSQNRTDTWQ